ncbi:MAG TPA: hypothetical protein VFW34_06955 [Candidatus Rubrimentiphilum sp.]|nr:hypothetical protein [Candidatus Rubrimentiphilum sp.]
MPQSAKTDRTVTVVLDPDYGRRLEDLRNEPATWIVDTPENRHAWQTYHMQRGSSALFSADDPESRLRNLLDSLPDIIDHFGPDTFPDEPYKYIRVIGLPLTEDVLAKLKERGLGDCVENADGFVADLPADT